MSVINDDSNHDYVAKVVLVGDSSVGKSNILSRLLTNTFTDEKKPTLGVEFGSQLFNVNDKIIKIQIWDTAGQEKYKSITNSYYINSKGALVVFDLSRQSSFNNVEKWLHDVKEVADSSSIILVGNKNDLTELRQVEQKEIDELKNKLGISYYETSALTGHNIKEVFQNLTELIYENYLSKINLDEDEDFKNSQGFIKMTNQDSNKSKGCC